MKKDRRHNCKPKFNGEVFLCECGKKISTRQIEEFLYFVNHRFETYLEFLIKVHEEAHEKKGDKNAG